jgi:outer membrane protein TolC
MVGMKRGLAATVCAISLACFAPSSSAQAAAPVEKTIDGWDQALSLLRGRSPDLRLAYDDVKQASAQVLYALAPILTTVTGQVTATHNFITAESALVTGVSPAGAPIFAPYAAPTPSYVQASLQLTQPIVSVQGIHAVKTARLSEEAAALSLADVKRVLTLRLAETLLAVFFAARLAEINRSALQDALDRAAIVKKREELGGGTGLDRARALQDVAAARAVLVAGDEALARTREALALVLGMAEPVGIAAALSPKDIEAGVARSCRGLDSADGRADVIAARTRAKVADRNVTNAYEQFLPTLVGQGSAALTTYATGAVPDKTLALSATLNVPLWDGAQRLGLVRNAKAVADATKERRDALGREATIEVARARRNVDVTERARLIALEARSDASEVERIVRAAYALGQGTSLDLMIAAGQLRAADRALAIAEHDETRARVAAALSSAVCAW